MFGKSDVIPGRRLTLGITLTFRSLGCECCTGKFDSDADTLEKIIAELKSTNIGEHAGRAQDNEDSYALQKLRREGYM